MTWSTKGAKVNEAFCVLFYVMRLFSDYQLLTALNLTLICWKGKVDICIPCGITIQSIIRKVKIVVCKIVYRKVANFATL